VFAIVISFIWMVSAAASATPARFIRSLFDMQTVCAFVLALLAGAFLASDGLSEERREGTLRLLFLTNLKASDIVVGKFSGAWLSAGYVLLTLLPVTALPLLLGGVGLAEFWRMALALVNTLFFSLATGLVVSAFVTHYIRSLFGTLSLLILFGALLPGCAVLGLTSLSAVCFGASWFSPFHPFWYARDTRYAMEPVWFWVSLLSSHLMAWVGLSFATYGVQRAWKDNAPGPRRWLPEWGARRPAAQPGQRRKSLDRPFDPVLRLVGQAPLLQYAVWLIVAAWAVLVCTHRFWLAQGMSDNFAARLCAFLLKTLFAFQACRFFVETRRTGAIELLLCAPLRNADLIQAQWRLLLRTFLWPLAIFLVFVWLAAALPPTPPAPAFAAAPPDSLPDLRTGFIGNFLLTLGVAADVLALGWFGMWLALTSRKPGLAPALTILAVLILPAVLSPFDLVADMLFVSWGTTRFQEEFRWVVATTLDARPRTGD
jgi:hypothetical protein